MSSLRVIVVGGNGFLGSAVCRAALSKGMQVTSVSSSGRPYRTPKGHTPTWVDKVDWRKGDAFQPSTFSDLFPMAYAVVHTLGTLLESTGSSSKTYKDYLKQSNVSNLVQAFANQFTSSNPFKTPDSKSTYEAINRDSALRVFESFLESNSPTPEYARPFVYISAEDVFRPFVPSRYITTKRQAEIGISKRAQDKLDKFKPIFVRPGLMYHPHQRPLTTLPATLLDVSVNIHRRISASLPTPAGLLRGLAPPDGSHDLSDASPLSSIANALTTPPMHVDQVAQALLRALQPGSPTANRILGVVEMQNIM